MTTAPLDATAPPTPIHTLLRTAAAARADCRAMFDAAARLAERASALGAPPSLVRIPATHEVELGVTLAWLIYTRVSAAPSLQVAVSVRPSELREAHVYDTVTMTRYPLFDTFGSRFRARDDEAFMAVVACLANDLDATWCEGTDGEACVARVPSGLDLRLHLATAVSSEATT